MPYSIQTKDGIRINNIPDDVPRDSQALKDRVADIRAEQSGQGVAESGRPAGSSRLARRQARRSEGKQRREDVISRIRAENPFLADLIEEQTPLDAFVIAAGGGLTNVGRGVGLADPEDEIGKKAMSGLKSQNPVATSAGELVGETAPFLLAGGPLSGIARTAGQKALATGAVGAAEGGILARGQGGSAGEIATGAVLGGFLGSGAELAAPAIGRASREVIDRIKGSPNKAAIDKAISESAPSVDDLRQASKEIYQELEDKNIRVSKRGIEKLAGEVQKSARKFGFRRTKASEKLSPQASAVLDSIDELTEIDVSFEDLENVRKSAQNAASVASNSGDARGAAIAGAVVDDVDEFLSLMDVKDLTGADFNVGREARVARDLWGRARKQEVLNEFIEQGERQAEGAERGIRNRIKVLLNNKKKTRFFSDKEKEALESVVKGDVTSNTFRRLGQMGFGRGQQTNTLGGLAGAGVGSSVLGSAFGPVGTGIGLVLLPAVGSVSKVLAERLTRNKAKMAGDLVRAGKNGRRIAEIYLSSTPKKLRNTEDLGALLTRSDVSLSNMPKNEFILKSVGVAEKLRGAAPVAALGATSVAAEEENE